MTHSKGKRIVEFKSVPEIYMKEKSGKKRNTCRYYSVEPKYILLKQGKATHIRIYKLWKFNQSFIRKIKDVTYWNAKGTKLTRKSGFCSRNVRTKPRKIPVQSKELRREAQNGKKMRLWKDNKTY